jgi:WNK lysine deficient protein kinase
LKSSFIKKDESLSTSPFSVSLVEIENVTEDGDPSDSFVFQKGEFLLKGHMDVTNPVVLSLRFPDPYGNYCPWDLLSDMEILLRRYVILMCKILSGGFKNAEFPLDVAKDTGPSVAMEMAEHFELPHGSIDIIAELIGAFLLVLIQYWRRSCVDMP